jgi:hypothetical protein
MAKKEILEQSKLPVLSNAELRLALLKENFEYQDFFVKFLKWEKEAPAGHWPGLGFNDFGLFGLRFLRGLPPSLSSYEKALDLINPQKEIFFPEEFIAKMLPKLFFDPAIEMIEIKGSNPSNFEESRVIKPIEAIERLGLKPWERIYKVDLRKKKTQIMIEFERCLDNAYLNNLKILYNKRDRSETLIHLEVWKLRKKRKNFSQIAKALNITLDAAKKSFYRAYELTQGKSYNPEVLKKEVWRVKKTDIKQTCDTCSKRNECEILCPDVLRYIDQDQIKRRKKLLSDPSLLENLS